jgi:AraC family transcriptional regulator
MGYELNKNIDYIKSINAAIDFIHNHLDDDLSLDKVAHEVAFSPYHFHRIFKLIVNEKLYSYICRVRIEQAVKKLVFHENMSIRDIGLDCGFQSLASFSRAFKGIRSLTPTEYRKKYAVYEKREVTFAELRFRQELLHSVNQVPVNGLDHVIAYAYKKIHDVTIQHLPLQKVVYNRHRGIVRRGMNWGIVRLFEETFHQANRLGLLSSSSQSIGVSHDDPYITPLHMCRFDACITVENVNEPVKEIELQVLQGGKYAVLFISETPQMICLLGDLLVQNWLPQSGYQLDNRPFLEKYYNNPALDPCHRIIMDLCIPIRPKP